MIVMNNEVLFSKLIKKIRGIKTFEIAHTYTWILEINEFHDF